MRATPCCGAQVLIVVASLLQSTGSRACGLQELGLSGSRAQVQWLWYMGLVFLGKLDPLGPGIEPVSFALQDGILTTGPPGKPHIGTLFCSGDLATFTEKTVK